MRGEMQCMGAGLQDGLDKVKKGQEQLKGEIGKNMTVVEGFKMGQEELRRATCWATEERRLVRVTETVTRTLKEEVTVTETCTRETGRRVTEYTETREMTRVEERQHGGDVVGDAHTQTHRGSEFAPASVRSAAPL